MAFQPKTQSTVKSKTSENLQFLTANNNSKPLTEEAQQHWETDAYKHTLKVLNSLKIVSPLVNAVMLNPGSDEKDTNINHTFKNLAYDISYASKALLDQMGIDSNDKKNLWMRNVLEKHLAQIVYEQWTTFGKVSLTNFTAIAKNLVNSEIFEEKSEYPSFDTNLIVQMTLIKALILIKEEYNKNSLFRNFEKDSESIATLLFETAKELLPKLVIDPTNEEQKTQIFNFLIEEGSKIFCSSWKVEVKRIENIINTYSMEKVKTYIDKYKKNGGFPITQIIFDYKKYLGHLVAISLKLVPSNNQNSGLGPRLFE